MDEEQKQTEKQGQQPETEGKTISVTISISDKSGPNIEFSGVERNSEVFMLAEVSKRLFNEYMDYLMPTKSDIALDQIGKLLNGLLGGLLQQHQQPPKEDMQ